jgi:thiamine biosynthesis lipoprotein
MNLWSMHRTDFVNEEHDSTFRSMGVDVRLLIGRPLRGFDASAERAAAEQRRFIERFWARMSPDDPSSELSALNDSPREAVRASPLLRQLVRAALWAASYSDGLVDPTILGDLEGLDHLAERKPGASIDALTGTPARQPAAPEPLARWRSIEVDDAAGLVRRPPGLRIDSGGVGRALVADMVGTALCGHARYVVDCGGELVAGGLEAAARPYELDVRHPLTGERVHTLRVSCGGVATSGLDVRAGRTGNGFAKHPIDPARGCPARTGVISATALGESALEAETRSKAALLLGPEGARRALAAHGGLVVHDDGDVELIGLADDPRPVGLRAPAFVTTG